MATFLIIGLYYNHNSIRNPSIAQIVTPFALERFDYYEWGQYLKVDINFHFVRSLLIIVSLLKRLSDHLTDSDVNRNEPLLISRKAELTQLFTSQFSSPNVEKSIFSLNFTKFKFRTRLGTLQSDSLIPIGQSALRFFVWLIISGPTTTVGKYWSNHFSKRKI